MKYDIFEKKVVNILRDIDPIYKKSFFIAFALINLAFLFHTINFMFGDHDWRYVRWDNYWSEGKFEGRPLHFLLQSMFFNGQILPVLNNLFSFAALAISGILLARYWSVPKTTFNYVIFSTYVASLPITMVWLFYAKDSLINLSLPLIGISALYISENKKGINWQILALLLFYFAFSSYVAIINLIAVCFLGKVLIDYACNTNIIAQIKSKYKVVINVFIALVLYKISLIILDVKSDYNTTVIPLDYVANKFMITLNVMFSQFVTPIPFMELKYKYLLLSIFIAGVIFVIIKSEVYKMPVLTLLLLAVLFSSKLAYFIADERGQLLTKMEDYAFVPRLDFYGLSYVYALGVALLLSYSKDRWYKFASIFVVVITFMSAVRDMYAQKVWKFGFDAEMKAHERIVSRLEQNPNFTINKQYKILQVGSLSMRKNFYIKQDNEKTILDLLETAFTPQYMSHLVYNFYYPKDIFIGNANISELSELGLDYLRHKAKAWPSLDSIYIDNSVIIVVVAEDGLEKIRSIIR